MKKSKKFLASLGVLVLVMTIFSSNALAAESVIDNDPRSDAPGFHEYEGNWVYKSGGYNNDHRLISSSNLAYADYTWVHKTLKNRVAAYHVYLANANFTNPKTAYQLGQTGNLVYVNQDTARSGWNHIGTVSDFTNAPFFLVLNGAMSSKTGSTGADAMKITY